MKYRLFFAISVGCVAMAADAGQAFKGFPPSVPDGNLLMERFRTPPPGYGTVPFYWWDGDSLDRDRLDWQLGILADAPVDGFSVSYIHSHPGIDSALNAGGYGGFGKPDPGRPGVFSDGWWDVWNWFSARCADKGMGLGLDDYVIGWEKNGYYVDEILADPEISGYRGRLVIRKYPVSAGKTVEIPVDSGTVAVSLLPGGEPLPFYAGAPLVYSAPEKSGATVCVVSAVPSHELHPEYGRRLCDTYFGRFEERLDEKARQSINYFFQDELHYDLNIRSWAEDMPEEFLRRKGYDIRPWLVALFENIGDITPKIRLDYADVVTQLGEERYFKPIFDWHDSRGLIYGCDNNGRGLEPLQYLDYFRMTSWFTAPGNDAPARGSSFRQTKVSSSISHLYGRPRTWLEAFHSMGWDSNGQWLTSQLDHHMIAGGNLLCMHGLYYSTHGGWWEWAPPCFFFRMPYWPHMKRWLAYGERLSYLLSQGTHVCDVAVLYPTESLQAYPDAGTHRMWQVADRLTERGIDYDFIDRHSLDAAGIDGSGLTVAGERYKALVLPAVKALHFSTLRKIMEFARAGGIVITTDDSLLATDRAGAGDEVALGIWRSMFGTPSGRCLTAEPDSIPDILRSLVTPDFCASSGKGHVLHRRIDDRNLYMVMNVAHGDELFFRATGKVEIWDAGNGTAVEQPVLRQDSTGTWIRFDGVPERSCLYMFSPGVPALESGESAARFLVASEPVDGDWEMEIIPTMDNRWGDFRLPASDGLIGPEAREFSARYAGPLRPGMNADAHYGFGPAMELAVIDCSVSLDSILSSPHALMDCEWEPYIFSWQYGVRDSPGSQGYHGLKGKLDNRFLILDRGGHQLFRTFMYAPADGDYVAVTEGVAPGRMLVDGAEVDFRAEAISLGKGWHELLIAYADTPEEEYRLEDKKSYCWDDRQRSAVVFYPRGSGPLNDNDPYGHTIATKWFGSNHLVFSPVKGKGLWEFRFMTAPATEKMEFEVCGTIASAAIDGKKLKAGAMKRTAPGRYVLHADGSDGRVHEVVLTAYPEPGYDGAAFFTGPVRLSCGTGKMPPCDWTGLGALKFYSGAIKYRRKIRVEELADRSFELDLGAVDATCEVTVNGKAADVLISAPYRLDITDLLHKGENEVEVLVYSTLSNHFQSIPSAYRGEPHAGLMGPVRLHVFALRR